MKKLFAKNQSEKHSCLISDPPIHILYILILVALLFVFGMLAAFLFEKTRAVARTDAAYESITMTGEGSASAKPDVAIMRAGLQTSAATVQEALAENERKMNAYLALLPSFGIAEKDRKTISYSVQPKYEYPTGESPLPSIPRLSGYTVMHTMQLKIRDLTKTDDVLAAIGSAGLNQVGDFSFGVDNPIALKNQAMEAALANAQEKIARFALLTGARIGKIISFYETAEQFGMGGIPSPMMGMEDKKAAMMMPDTEKGEHEIKSVVSVTYKIIR